MKDLEMEQRVSGMLGVFLQTLRSYLVLKGLVFDGLAN